MTRGGPSPRTSGAATAATAAFAAFALLAAGALLRPARLPTAHELERRAHSRLDDARRALDDDAQPIDRRMAAYRRHVEAAVALYGRSLRIQPAQPDTLLAYAGLRRETASLAGQRFDLDPWVATAESLAPASARTHQRLAELLFLLGRPDEARAQLRETVRLDPERADEAVALLRRRGERAVEIVAQLPPLPEVVLAARPHFHQDGAAEALSATLVARAEEGGWTPRLLRAAAEADRHAGAPDRALARLDGLAGRADLEPERSLQRALTLDALDRGAEAIAAARDAAEGSRDPSAWEILGVLERRGGRPDRAVEAFDRALHRVAERSGSPAIRARLYRRRGRAHEDAGRLDRAIVDYRRALSLDPGEADAADALGRLTGR